MSKILPGKNKIFDDVVTKTSLCRHLVFLAPVREENPNFFVFPLIWLKFGAWDNVQMLITKIIPD